MGIKMVEKLLAGAVGVSFMGITVTFYDNNLHKMLAPATMVR